MGPGSCFLLWIISGPKQSFLFVETQISLLIKGRESHPWLRVDWKVARVPLADHSALRLTVPLFGNFCFSLEKHRRHG